MGGSPKESKVRVDEVDEMTAAMLDVEGKEYLSEMFAGMMIVPGLEKAMRSALILFFGQSHPELSTKFLDRIEVKFGGSPMVQVYLRPSSSGRSGQGQPRGPSAPRGGGESGNGSGGGSDA